jgi:hypothetical protein
MMDHRSQIWLTLLILLHLNVITLYGQTFNKRFDPYNTNEDSRSSSVEVHDNNGNIIVFIHGRWSEDSIITLKLGTLILNSNGQSLDTALFPVPGKGVAYWASHATFRRNTGAIVAIGAITPLANIYVPEASAAFFFDQNGQPNSMSLYSTDTVFRGNQIIETNSGNWIITGYKQASNSPQYIMKLSSSFETLWTQYEPTNSGYRLHAVAEGPDSVYYVAGFKEFSQGTSDFFLKAVNSEGVAVWDTTWNQSYYDRLTSITIASDGNLLVAGAYTENIGYNMVKYIAKMNSADGSILWQHSFGANSPWTSNESNGILTSMKKLPNGDLIAVGDHTINGPVGFLLRTTSEGDSLWMRYYTYQDSLSEGYGVFRDVEPTLDGGFVAVGNAIPIPGHNRNAWVVKVDSYGCIEPGCHIITGMETQITNMPDVIDLWPNPIMKEGDVQIQLKIPDHFKPHGQLRVTITSSDGRSVHEQTLVHSSIPQEIDLPQLSSGLYHLHLLDTDRWISGAKLVID